MTQTAAATDPGGAEGDSAGSVRESERGVEAGSEGGGELAADEGVHVATDVQLRATDDRRQGGRGRECGE